MILLLKVFPILCLLYSTVCEDVDSRDFVNTRDVNFDVAEKEYVLYKGDPSRPNQKYPMALPFLFISSTLLAGVIVRAVMLSTSMCIPYRVIMFALGGILGFCASKFPEFKPIVVACYSDVDVLLLIFFPTLVFNTSYNVDSHAFLKSSFQLVLVALPGSLLTALFVSFMAFYVIETSWSFPTAMLFGIVCAPTYPMEVVKQLKEMSKGKYLSVLLLGEGILGDVTVMIVFTALSGYLSLVMTGASQLSLMLLRYIGGGILLGIVAGKITAMILSLTYYDLFCAVTVTFAAAYLTYYIGEKFFYVSGLLGTVIAGVIISSHKQSVAGEVEHVVSHFWNILAHAANTLIFTIVGVIIFERVSDVITVRQISLVFVTYTTVYVSRLLVYLALMPILRQTGYGMTWQQMFALAWGGLRGPLSLCLALVVLETAAISQAGEVNHYHYTKYYCSEL